MHYLWSTVSSIAIMASMTFSSNKRRNDVAELATRWLSVLLDIQLTLFADTWGAALTEILIEKLSFFKKTFYLRIWFIEEWVNMSKLTFLVEIRIYSTYIWQQEMILYTPYIIAVLVIVLRTGDDWNICYKQTRPLLEVAHDLLLKPPSSLQFLTHLSVAGRRKRNIRTKSWKILEMEIVHRNIWYHTWYFALWII